MLGAMSLLFRQVGAIWSHFGINQKVSIILALLVTLSAIGGILYTSRRPDYRLLVAGLTLPDAAKAREQLEEAKIDVQLRDGGNSIYVPAADVYRVFDQIPADPEAARRIQPLIGLLDSDDAAQRDQAQKKIVESGRAGVLACLRLDSSVLSPEQKSRLDSIYRSEGWMGAGDIEQARRPGLAGFLPRR